MSTTRYQCAARDCRLEWSDHASPGRPPAYCPHCRSRYFLSRPVVGSWLSPEAGDTPGFEGMQAAEFIQRGLMRSHLEASNAVVAAERGTRRRPDGTVEEYERLEFGAR